MRYFACRKSNVLLAGLLALVMLDACAAPKPGDISLPLGFHIELFADNVPNARSMALGDMGTLFVGTRTEGKVYALRDEDGDNRADRRYVLASDLYMPNGIAFRDGALYVAESGRLLRFDDIEAHLSDPPAPVVVTEFEAYRHHGWRHIGFGPDGKLYLTWGAPCNVCDMPDYGQILRMNPDGSAREVVARGVRNSVGITWHPRTGKLWFTDNGRDMLGDDLPPDELNRLGAAGQHFGFPFCHGGDIPDPEFAKPSGCDGFTPPVQRLGAHVASLGLRFYTGNQFPAEYHHQLFIAEHGSWNRSKKSGYRISLVRLQGDRAASYEPFAQGWLNGDRVSGRPVDILMRPQGDMLVSDDHAGVVYRIYWQR